MKSRILGIVLALALILCSASAYAIRVSALEVRTGDLECKTTGGTSRFKVAKTTGILTSVPAGATTTAWTLTSPATSGIGCYINATTLTSGSALKILGVNGTMTAAGRFINLFDDATSIWSIDDAGTMWTSGGASAIKANTVSAGTNGIAIGLTASPGVISGSTHAGYDGGAISTEAGAGSAGKTSGAGGVGGAITNTAGAGGAAAGNTYAGGAGGAITTTLGAGGAGLTTGVGGAGGLFSVVGGAGGGSGAASTNGGAGSPFTFANGEGGAVTTSGTGGAGGYTTFTAGAGGQTATGTAGAAGYITATAGAGGACTGNGTPTVGGAVTLQAGAGGAEVGGTGAVGGAITLTAGTGGASTTGGAGGAINLYTGVAGAGGSPAAGALTVKAGGASGTTAMTVTGAGVVNFPTQVLTVRASTGSTDVLTAAMSGTLVVNSYAGTATITIPDASASTDGVFYYILQAVDQTLQVTSTTANNNGFIADNVLTSDMVSLATASHKIGSGIFIVGITTTAGAHKWLATAMSGTEPLTVEAAD